MDFLTAFENQLENILIISALLIGFYFQFTDNISPFKVKEGETTDVQTLINQFGDCFKSSFEYISSLICVILSIAGYLVALVNRKYREKEANFYRMGNFKDIVNSTTPVKITNTASYIGCIYRKKQPNFIHQNNFNCLIIQAATP